MHPPFEDQVMHGAEDHRPHAHTAVPFTITCWNVHGLKPEKLEPPPVQHMLDNATILVLTETWLECDEAIPSTLLNRYTCYGLHRMRSTRKGRPSGGILVCVHKSFAKVSLHTTHSDEGIIWIHFHSHLPHEADLFLAACYFSPENATVWSRTQSNPFDTLYNDIATICSLGNYIITGDLNARTGAGIDVHPANNDLSHFANVEIPPESDCLIPSRASCDTGTNGFGQQLLQLCAGTGTCIVNGRLHGDHEGSCTYLAYTHDNTSSLVDYFLCPPSIIFDQLGVAKDGAQLHVNHSACLRALSDHWPLTLTLPHGTAPSPEPADSSTSHHTRQRQLRTPQSGHLQHPRWVWDNDMQQAYVNSLCMAGCHSLLDQILTPGSTDYTAMISLLKSALDSAATHAKLPKRSLLPAINTKRKTHAVASAPWYQHECREAFQAMQSADPGHAQRQAMRKYKAVVRRAKRGYSRARHAKMLDLLQHKPKQFWSAMRNIGAVGTCISKDRFHTYYRTLRAPTTHAAAPPDYVSTFNEPDSHAAPHDESLDKQFTVADTTAALDVMKSGKTADMDGTIAELLTKATLPEGGGYLLAPHLTCIINAIFLSGTFPESETVGMIIPIYKGNGDIDDCNNYRGITIISVLSKLYATMLNMRLSKWREMDTTRKAYGQGGFVKDHRTTDHVFILQHLIDKYRKQFRSKRDRANSRALFGCFVDLSKAFDTISRDKLWCRLHHLGIQGTMLTALQAYYADVRECVKTADGFTPTFTSGIGVKQGCPLSPTLFCFYIDAVEAYINHNTPEGGSVMVGQHRISLLLYADDILFLATSEQELQNYLDIFSDFCYRYELTLNVKKTEVVIFTTCRTDIVAHVTYRGVQIPQRNGYKYLGITFTGKNGCKFAGDSLLISARKAMFALEKQLRLENITNVAVCIQMFDSLVTPILTYAAEIWGCYGKWEEADKLHLGFLKRILCVPISTETTSVYAETGCLPLHTRIMECQARYWNRLWGAHAADPERLLSVAFVENRGMMNCWCTRYRNTMDNLQPQLWVTADPHAVRYVMTSDLHQCLQASSVTAGTDHRDFYTHHLYEHAEHARRRTYATWFWSRDGKAAAANNIDDDLLRRTLVRFRLGAHGLRVTTACWTRGFVERRHRLCQCCSMGIVEDEFHLVFECPLYQQHRLQYSALFEGFVLHLGDDCVTCQISDEAGSMMRKFFAHANQYKLAKFIAACGLTRKQYMPA